MELEQFNISDTVLQGLKNLDTPKISFEVARKLIANCVTQILHQPKATVPPVEQQEHLIKQSEYAIIAITTLASRHCCDASDLRQILENNSLSAAIVDEFVRVYEENHKDLLFRQLQLGQIFAHISDVQWRIVCNVKSSTSEGSSGEVGFQINLGHYDAISGDRKTVAEFLCNTEELQLLIGKLKEIERHCVRVARE